MLEIISNNFVTSAIVPLIVMSVTLLVQYRYRRQDKKEEIRNLAKVLSVEINIFVKTYEPFRLPEKLPDNLTELRFCKNLTENNFFVFENNTHRLGIFDENDIEEINKFYINLMALISAASELYGKTLIKNYFDSKSDNPENWQEDKELLSLYAKTKEYDVAVFNGKNKILAILDKYKK